MTILARRLKTVLQDFIHEDLSGFLPKKQLRDNIRNVLNVLQAALMF